MKGETTPSAIAGGAGGAGGAAVGLSPLGALVRRHDRDRYLTALFAPADRREALFAVFAFNYEIARVRESVQQPMLGQIRLQWWREVIAAAYAGAAPRRHEVAAPLTAAIRAYRLPRGPLDRMIDAREQDLGDAPPAGLAALEDYAEATSATLIGLVLAILAPREVEAWEAAEAAAGDVGIAYALVGLLRTMPFHAAAGRCYVPSDVAARAGLDPADYAGLRVSVGLRQAVAAIAAVAETRLRRARERRDGVPRAALPALLPAVIAERSLGRLRHCDWDPFDPAVAAPDPLLPWRLAAAYLRRRF